MNTPPEITPADTEAALELVKERMPVWMLADALKKARKTKPDMTIGEFCLDLIERDLV